MPYVPGRSPPNKDEYALDLTGWYVGYAIAAAVIVVVVMLVGWILSTARRIGTQVNAIVSELSLIAETTAPIATVDLLNQKLTNVVQQAAMARGELVAEP